MAAAEIYGSLGRALAGGGDAVLEAPKTHDTIAVSIGATRSTYQALAALRASGGAARSAGNDELSEWQARLARTEGLWFEASSVAPLAAIRQLREAGAIGADARVVAVATAAGLKDPAPAAARQGEVPVVPPSIDAAIDTLRNVYGFLA